MTNEKTESGSTDFLSDLRRVTDLLTEERLIEIQKLLEAGDLKEEALVEKVGVKALGLIAMTQAALSEPTIILTAPEEIANGLRSLGSRLETSAPALLAHPRIQAVAKRFADSVKADETREEEKEVRLPFDDIDGYRASTAYLEREEKLAPTVRCEISFSNRPAFPPITLRLIDVALLAAALTESLANALESCGRLARVGVLDESELDGARRYVDELVSEVNRVKELLNVSSAPSTATIKK